MKSPPTAESIIDRDGEGAPDTPQNPIGHSVLSVVDTLQETANFVGEISGAIASGSTSGAADPLSSGVGAATASPLADVGDCGGCDCGCTCVVS